jgi:hypothetical protein
LYRVIFLRIVMLKAFLIRGVIVPAHNIATMQYAGTAMHSEFQITLINNRVFVLNPVMSVEDKDLVKQLRDYFEIINSSKKA